MIRNGIPLKVQKHPNELTKLGEGGAYSSSLNTTSHVEEEAWRRPPGV